MDGGNGSNASACAACVCDNSFSSDGQVATLGDHAPQWDAFFAERVFWPFVALILCSLMVRGLKPLYNKARRGSHNFRYFLIVYVGTPDREYVSNPWLTAAIFFLRGVLAFAATSIAIWRTYTFDSGDMVWTSALIRTFFVSSYLFLRLKEGFDWTMVWSLDSIVDVMAITPYLMPRKFDLTLVPAHTRWLSLDFMRIVTALNSFLALRKLFRNEAASQTLIGRVVVAILRVIVLCICMGGAIYVLEVLGEIPRLEDKFVQTGMGDLSFFQMCYWIVTTISTVGYGDFSPTTIPARLAIVFFIFGGVIFFGTETASFVDLLDEHSKGLGSYHNTSRSARHILVTGGGAHKFSSLMESFLLETLTGELEENQIPDVVFLSEQEYDEDLRSFVDYELASSLAAKVFFLRGSVMNLRDLERVMVESAVICLVLPDLDTESPQTEDSISVMMAMTMTRHFPGLRLRIMLLEPEGAKNAALLSIAFPRCFSAHEMKCAIFAKSTHVAGLVTFLSGLMQSRVDYSMDQLEKLSRGDKKNHWRLEYSRSLKKNLIGFVIAPHLAEQAFPSVARRVYEESNGEVLLIAVAKAGKLLLNHMDFIHAGQVVVAIAARERHCLPFAECQGNVLKEWRFQFLHARSQRLKDESAQSVHHGKAGEVLLLHQPGLDRKWFLSKKPAGRSRTAAAGISSFQVDAMVREVSQDGHANLDKLRSFLEEAPSQMKGTDSAEARQRAAPDLEALKRHPRLTLLVVFHEEAQPIWPQLVCFLHYFHQQSEILDKAIIVLSGMQPPESILEEWEGQNCCFLVGKLTNTMNLRHAGVESAKNIIIMGRKRPQENVYLRTTALADAECVTIAGYIEQALAKKNALTGWRSSQSVLYEFGYTNSVFLTGHLFEVATRPAGRISITKGDVAIAVTESEALSHTDSRRSDLPSSEKEGSRVDRLNRMLDQGSFALNESFAAGQAFTLDFFGGLLGHIYKFPACIEFLQMVLMPQSTEQASELWQVPCPPDWVGRTFGALVMELIQESGSEREAFGNWRGCALPVALYRQSRDRFLTPSSSGFTSTLPKFDSKLEALDLITVLAPESFIEAQPRVVRADLASGGVEASGLMPATLDAIKEEQVHVISVREEDMRKVVEATVLESSDSEQMFDL